MKNKIILIVCLLTIGLAACRKEKNSKAECFSNVPTVREINHEIATIKFTGNKYYIILKNSIDSQLDPCNLAAEYQEDNLKVAVSGEVKLSLMNGPVCCTEPFVITDISK